MGTVDVTSLSRWIREFAHSIAANKELLTRLDAAIGDGDHGVNMDRGFAAVVAVMDEQPPLNVAALLKNVVARTITSTGGVGGAGGALYGAFFRGMAQAADSVHSLDDAAFAAALRAGLNELVRLGMPKAGDKTMFDALDPALDALEIALAAHAGLGEALGRAAVAAAAGRDRTEEMRGGKGRASLRPERSIGHVDPGAASAALLIAAAATVFEDPVFEDVVFEDAPG
ncbi:MAG: dihydroxyacetone kinase subunit DhaL [Pseudonocardiaceae bacterium]